MCVHIFCLREYPILLSAGDAVFYYFENFFSLVLLKKMNFDYTCHIQNHIVENWADICSFSGVGYYNKKRELFYKDFLEFFKKMIVKFACYFWQFYDVIWDSVRFVRDLIQNSVDIKTHSAIMFIKKKKGIGYQFDYIRLPALMTTPPTLYRSQKLVRLSLSENIEPEICYWLCATFKREYIQEEGDGGNAVADEGEKGGGRFFCTPKTWAGAHGQWNVVIAFFSSSFFSLQSRREGGGKVDGLERRRLV